MKVLNNKARLSSSRYQYRPWVSPVFVKKVLSEHCLARSLPYWVYGCCVTIAEFSSCDRDSMAHKAYGIYCLDFYRKTSADSWNRCSNTKANAKYSSKWANSTKDWKHNVVSVVYVQDGFLGKGRLTLEKGWTWTTRWEGWTTPRVFSNTLHKYK